MQYIVSTTTLPIRILKFVFYYCSLEKLEGRYSWLKDEKFVRDIESDSVDSDILDEELHTLQVEDSLT